MHPTPPFFFNYRFPKLELELKLFLMPIGSAAVCAIGSCLCRGGKAGHCTAGHCMELTTPVPKSLHFNCLTGDNRCVEMGHEENSGILDSLKPQLFTHSLILPSQNFTVLFSQESLLCFFLTEDEEQWDNCACYKRASGWNLLLNQIVLRRT